MYQLTSNASQELSGKALDVGIRERNEAVAFEKIEETQVQKVCDDTDMATEVETVSEMDAPVSIVGVVVPKRLQSPELDLSGIAVLLHGADDLHGDELAGTAVKGFDYLSESALPEEVRYTVCTIGQYLYAREAE